MSDGPRLSVGHFFPATAARKPEGWRRHADAGLRRLGPTWRAAPARRGVQVLALGLYLGLFFYVAWPYADVFTDRVVAAKEWAPLETFLWIDPLVGLSTAIAARAWNVAVLGAGAVLLLSVLFPRAFCGYLCPLGTLIDGFDWLVGRRVTRLRVKRVGGWAYLRFYLLAAVLIGSVLGVLLAGYLAAIPVLTRGLLFTAGRVETGLLKNWGQVGAADAAVYLSVVLWAVIFLLGFLAPRFWCRYVCPSGALISLFSFLRITGRQVGEACTGCGRCAKACPFDAVGEHFAARRLECAFCQTCGGVCPAHAIGFGPRGGGRREQSFLPTRGPVSRRAFLLSAVGGTAAAVATRPSLLGGRAAPPPLLRPPGSVEETAFLRLCIRCGECFKVCPGPVLRPAGFENGLDALWTPVAVPSHAGCHQDCNFCTQVCPTGAIVPLDIAEKRRTRMGLAVIDRKKCLPHRGERDCRLCFEECRTAGYHAIEMRQIDLNVGPLPDGVLSQDEIDQMAHIEAPFIVTDRCTGCGLCEYRCASALVKQRRMLDSSAVVITPQNADRPKAWYY